MKKIYTVKYMGYTLLNSDKLLYAYEYLINRCPGVTKNNILSYSQITRRMYNSDRYVIEIMPNLHYELCKYPVYNPKNPLP